MTEHGMHANVGVSITPFLGIGGLPIREHPVVTGSYGSIRATRLRLSLCRISPSNHARTRMDACDHRSIGCIQL